MTSPVKAIPDGYHTATPYLIIKGAASAIEFYKKAFGATELMRMAQPDGQIGLPSKAQSAVGIGSSPAAFRFDALANEPLEIRFLAPSCFPLDSLSGS